MVRTFESIVIFGDGACSGNPGKGGWGVVIARPNGHVTELGGHAPETTNNRMEMLAVIKSLEAIESEKGSVAVHTDSVYVIRGITQWIYGWRSRGWKTAAGEDVANKDLWEWMSQVVYARKGTDAITWHYVRGHRGTPGNERVDEIAVGFTGSRNGIDLYDGPLKEYHVAIYDIPEDTSLPEMKERAAKVAAYSYLSVVDGVLRRHKTWPECERLVKGRSGARFKKTTSAAEEEEIAAGWGKSISDCK
jgi:ribonuclease HI